MGAKCVSHVVNLIGQNNLGQNLNAGDRFITFAKSNISAELKAAGKLTAVVTVVTSVAAGLSASILLTPFSGVPMSLYTRLLLKVGAHN